MHGEISIFAGLAASAQNGPALHGPLQGEYFCVHAKA